MIKPVIKRNLVSRVVNQVLGIEDVVVPIYEYQFDNVDDVITFDEKVYDPANPAFELEGYFDLANYDGTLFSQNTSSSSGSREFQLYKTTSSGLRIYLGGSLRTLENTNHNQAGLWCVKLYGNATDGWDFDISLDGVLLGTVGWSAIGSATEPGALPVLAGRSDNAADAFSSLLGGVIKNFKFWKGDRETGELLIDLPINEGGAGVVENYAGTATATANNFNPENWTQL